MNIYGDVVGGEESFYIPAGDFCAASGEGKKPQKLLMIPGGSFGGSPVGVSPELRIPASVASPTPLPHTALLATASQQSDLFSSFFIWKKSSKVWKVINSRVFFFGMLYNVKNHVLMHREMHTAHIYR